MKKFFFKVRSVLVLSLALIFSACSKSETSSDINNIGLYKVNVTQTGDLNSFTISGGVTGGNSFDKGIIDALTNEYKGFAYALTEEENYRSSYSYKTTGDGAWISCSIAVVGSDVGKEMIIKQELFFDDKLVGVKEAVFNGGSGLNNISINSVEYKN